MPVVINKTTCQQINCFLVILTHVDSSIIIRQLQISYGLFQIRGIFLSWKILTLECLLKFNKKFNLENLFYMKSGDKSFLKLFLWQTLGVYDFFTHKSGIDRCIAAVGKREKTKSDRERL